MKGLIYSLFNKKSRGFILLSWLLCFYSFFLFNTSLDYIMVSKRYISPLIQDKRIINRMGLIKEIEGVFKGKFKSCEDILSWYENTKFNELHLDNRFRIVKKKFYLSNENNGIITFEVNFREENYIFSVYTYTKGDIGIYLLNL